MGLWRGGGGFKRRRGVGGGRWLPFDAEGMDGWDGEEGGMPRIGDVARTRIDELAGRV